MELKLDSPVQYVPRVGPAMSLNLKRLNINSVGDLLWHAPFRYNDFSQVSPISRVRPGEIVTIRGEIKSFANVFTKHGKKMQVASVFDDSGKIDVIWFNQIYLISVLKPGMLLNLAGEISWFGRKMSLISPDYEIVNASNDANSLHTGRLVPIYPETEGVSSKWLRGRIAYLIEQGLADLPDPTPDFIKKQYGLMNLSDAIKSIHYPISAENAKAAKTRLAFDELMLLQLTALEKRRIWETTQKSHQITVTPIKINEFISKLPFNLTSDQQKSIAEISDDIQKPYPMNRLLEGDVGSGKTVVAAIAMYAANLNGLSSILMAPTQILAEQHFNTINTLFKPFGIPVKLVTGETNRKTDRSKNNMEKEGLFPTMDQSNFPTVFIGTHALLSDSVNLDNAGLVIIDEQQRFGVAQRKLIREKGANSFTPHLLAMTATPIPRTLTLAVLGDLSLSVISQMPQGRIPVTTWVVPNEKRSGAYTWIKTEIIKNQSQAFIVCPLIDESETLTSVRSVLKEFEHLKVDVFPDLKLELLHGRLKPAEKTRVLNDFQANKFQILVTTPVVEVGIDIPRAGIMMIEASDRFGLSQLHQLRGRVGRRNQKAYCLLFTESTEDKAINRLKSLETVHNGPELADIDLRFRGPGEVFGTRQHGLPNLKFADIFNTELLNLAQQTARRIVGQDAQLTDFPLLRDKLNQSIINIDDLSN
jgi:ATP-dependent DNA helicase RecG